MNFPIRRILGRLRDEGIIIKYLSIIASFRSFIGEKKVSLRILDY